MRKETKNWLKSANYDIETAKHMLDSSRYIYVIFMCHLALEKVLKALVIEQTNELPPKTHDLLLLASRAKVKLSSNFKEFIGAINNASIVTRYPSDLSSLIKDYNKEVADNYLEKTMEILEWLKQDSRLREI